eukprot:TRINITY_DN1071_c0_g5_i1.p1 TRINITY_DN1071_c0_g5~~TRINITY_DN1071_c0_g5_i1.p1  ORF type:complete len:200 (+),score=20.75 TRINITY_DN1071_c0_g5_i1:68-667(+)
MTNKKEESVIETIIKGPSHGYTDNFPMREMWKEIAHELNGEFKIKLTSGNELEIHEISIPYKKWNIQISVSDTKPMKVAIEFTSSLHFELLVGWEDFIEKIIKKFFKPEIELGWEKFDKKYVIKSNRSDLAKRILTKDIQKTLLKYDVYSISYRPEANKKTAELISVIQQQVGDREMVMELVEMYKKLIDALENARVIR